MENDFEEVEVSEIGDVSKGLQIYQQDKAMIDMQIATAKRYPRNLRRAIENAVTVVSLSKETAQSCTYSLKKGGKLITGPSVNLAKIVAQNLGNMRVENRVVGYDATHVTCEAVCFDLERNYAIRTQIKRSIVGERGRYSEDMAVIVGNAGNAIALRNAIFAVVDKAIIDKVYQAALNKISGDLSSEDKLTAKRVSLFKAFREKYDEKLTDEEICSGVGKKYPDQLTAEDVVALIGFENSLSNGEIEIGSIFRSSRFSEAIPKTEVKSNHEEERVIALINSTKKYAELEKLLKNAKTQRARDAYDLKAKELKDKK